MAKQADTKWHGFGVDCS